MHKLINKKSTFRLQIKDQRRILIYVGFAHGVSSSSIVGPQPRQQRKMRRQIILRNDANYNK